MEKLIYQRLAELGEKVFYSKAADDLILEPNYPLIVFSLEKFTNPIHLVAGLLTVEVISSQTTTKPEKIAKKIIDTLQGVFFNSGVPFILRWQKTEPFEEPASERTPLIVGNEILFDVYEFPSQLTSEPDLVQGVDDWLKNFSLLVKDLPEIFIPTAQAPLLWCSLKSVKLLRQMAAACFVEGEVSIHVFCNDSSARRRWLTTIQTELLFVKAIRLFDGCPARLTSCNLDFSRDEIAGQISATFEYGIGKRFVHTHGLKPKIN